MRCSRWIFWCWQIDDLYCSVCMNLIFLGFPRHCEASSLIKVLVMVLGLLLWVCLPFIFFWWNLIFLGFKEYKVPPEEYVVMVGLLLWPVCQNNCLTSDMQYCDFLVNLAATSQSSYNVLAILYLLRITEQILYLNLAATSQSSYNVLAILYLLRITEQILYLIDNITIILLVADTWI
jgi:hypothetical protein